MNIFIILFVFLELLVHLFYVVSYTVVLKQVKPLYPAVKFYKYEVRHPKIITENNAQYIYHKPVTAQRLYPITVKHQRDPSYRTRVPIKKEKRKYTLKSTSTTENSSPRDQRLYNLPQQLVPPVSNQIEDYSENKEEESRPQEHDTPHILSVPLQEEKSFPSFGQEKGKIYNRPGEWATPAPSKDSENSTKSVFTPSQLYLQIRHKNTVIHVPQSEALKDAETLEELINAPRLKELARTTHVQEVYSEEGYEDAGYDHAGHIRHAAHGEVYDAKDEGRFKIKDPPVILDYDSDLEESKKAPLKQLNTKDDFRPVHLAEKVEPRIIRSQAEKNKKSVEFAKTPHNYKGEHKYSSKIKNSDIIDHQQKEHNFTGNKYLPAKIPSFPSYFSATPFQDFVKNETMVPLKLNEKKSSKYRKEDLNSTKIYPITEVASKNIFQKDKNFTNSEPYISEIDSQASPSAKSLKYSRIYSKKTKQLRLEPYKTGKVYEPPTDNIKVLHVPRDKVVNGEPINERIVLPTIGYINSLTTAHFGKGSQSNSEEESKPQLTSALNLTQALNYLRVNQNQKNLETTVAPLESEIPQFEPMKLKAVRSHFLKTKRDVYLVKDDKKHSEEVTEGYEENDSSDLPHNEKNKEIAEDEKKRIEEENLEKEKYEIELNKEISKKEKEILKQTFDNLGIREDFSEIYPVFPVSDDESDDKDSTETSSETKEDTVDLKKYPFYFSKLLPENSPLRYATNPKEFPRKSGYKMEFYESRERLIQCPDFHPNLDDLPNSNSTEYSDNQPGENQRLAGLGDKILCLRSKYFGEEPLDNPIFKEKEIDYVGKPKKVQKNIFKTNIKSSETKTVPKQEKSHLTLTKSKKTKNTNNKLQSKKNFLNAFESHPVASNRSSVNQSYNKVQQKIKNLNSAELKQSLKKVLVLPEKTENAEKIENPYIRSTTISFLKLANSTPDAYYNSPNSNPFHVNSHSQKESINNLKKKPFIYSFPEIFKNKIVMRHNCLNSISKLAALNGNRNLTIECNDGILIQEIINGIGHLKIIPRNLSHSEFPYIQKSWTSPTQGNVEDEWIPIVGYTFPSNGSKNRAISQSVSRKTDEVFVKNHESAFNTSTDHYIIDELKEDENVRKGEVIEDMDHYLVVVGESIPEIPEVTTTKVEISKTENKSREKRLAQEDQIKLRKKSNMTKRLLVGNFDNDTLSQNVENLGIGKNVTEASEINVNSSNKTEYSRPFESKRTLTRLSGRDFLVRYHKKKGKPLLEKSVDFWRISPTQNTEKSTSKYQNNDTELKKFNISSEKYSEKTKDKDRSSSEEFHKTIPIKSLVENKTNQPEIKENMTFSKPAQLDIMTEKSVRKSESKPVYQVRKIVPLNLIPEKITKRPEIKQSSEFRNPLNLVNEKSTIVYQNEDLVKIGKKLTRDNTEGNEKHQVGEKKSEQSDFEFKKNFSGRSEKPLYKTIDRSVNNLKKNNSEENNRYIESSVGPVLYYVVNTRTGRGKWITNYDEQKVFQNRKKRRKIRKLIEGARGDKRRRNFKKS